jgi:heme/copper-type cytochrome/quinol oxidase subunit 2
VVVSRVREIMSGPASGALVLLMVAGCLFLWIGVPLGWLWIGSQVQGSASLGTAMLVTMLGITATTFVVVAVLAWLNRRHAAIQERRNPERGGNALEALLVASAGIAIVGFGVWFFGFAGASPVPLNIGF